MDPMELMRNSVKNAGAQRLDVYKQFANDLINCASAGFFVADDPNLTGGYHSYIKRLTGDNFGLYTDPMMAIMLGMNLENSGNRLAYMAHMMLDLIAEVEKEMDAN